MDKELDMPQDMKQAFELLKDCAEKYPHFAVFVKNYPHSFTLVSQPKIPEYKFEFYPEDHIINIRPLNGLGFDMHLFFSDGYGLKAINTYDSRDFIFHKDELNEVRFIFYRDLKDENEDEEFWESYYGQMDE